MIDQNIIEKIKKLNALANNAGTEAEAAAAAARVAELCMKHNLELGSVLIEKEEKEATETFRVDRGNYQAHWYGLARAVESLFDVGSYKTRTYEPVKDKNGFISGNFPGYQMVFFGLKANVESALLTYSYLLASVESMLGGWIREGNPADQKSMRSFRMGCSTRIFHEAKNAAGIGHAQIQGNAECMAIVRLSNQIVQAHAVKKRLRNSGRVSRPGSGDAYRAGYAAGARVDLHGARSSRMLA